MQFPPKPKVLVVFGSPHPDGNTAKLLRAYLTTLPNDSEIEYYDTFKVKPLPCTDCGYCKKHFSCAFDDLNDFYKNFETADLIVIATPIYNLSYPAPLKAVFDRFQMYYNARFERTISPTIKKRRQGVLLLTYGSSRKDSIELIQKQTALAFSVLNLKLVQTIAAGGLDNAKIEDFIQDTFGAKVV